MAMNKNLNYAQKIRLKNYLKSECNYNDKEVRQAIEAVEKMTPEIRENLMEYIITGNSKTLVIENVTAKDFMERGNMNIVSAFLCMDYLRTSPEEAKYVLTRRSEMLEFDKETAEIIRDELLQKQAEDKL